MSSVYRNLGVLEGAGVVNVPARVADALDRVRVDQGAVSAIADTDVSGMPDVDRLKSEALSSGQSRPDRL